MFPEPLIALRSSTDQRVREVHESVECVIETGSGIGFVTELFAVLYPEVIAVEKSEKVMAASKDYLHNTPHVRWICGDSEDILPTLIDASKSYVFYLHAVKCDPIFYDDGHIEAEVPKEGNTALPQELKIISASNVKCVIVTPVVTTRETFQDFGDRLIHHSVEDGVTYAVIC